jgi:Holliday junction resolvasome RuvABC DNA-binding subunit
MFGFISGKIKSIRSDGILIDSGNSSGSSNSVFNLGFIVYLSKNIIKKLSIGDFCEFLIETKIKNSEQIMLYGFENEFQRIFFNHLCSISGISDKIALNISGLFLPKDLLDYCLQIKKEIDFKIDGVGPKTWEKILFYLGRNKNLQQICLESISLNHSISDANLDQKDDYSSIFLEAKMALISLGIPSSSVINLLESVSEKMKKIKNLKTEDVIKEALSVYR